MFYELQTKSTGGLVPQLKENQMKSKIIQTLVEYVLAIIIFGGIGVLLAWRGWDEHRTIKTQSKRTL